MESREAAEERLLSLAQGLDFARRYYALVATTRDGKPSADLPAADIAAALESTGRAFRFNRKERFYATREPDTPGELGLNLAIRGAVEFILVARTPAGHIGDVFHGLALELARRHAPELVPDPPYPRPWFRDRAELRRVLADGLGLYAELAAAIRTEGLLG
ncbi:MAG TPA: hypothetical protein VD866_30115 [Urbifossiella sp.]|nr:hypothetical protein [Urbifossiella sp.]